MYQPLELWDVFIPVTYPDVAYNRYIISNTGRIKDTVTGMMVNETVDPWGFPIVSLFARGAKLRTVKVRVHRLVAWEFCPEQRIFDYGVGHIDNDKHNNYYQNLAWIPPEPKKKEYADPVAAHIINAYEQKPKFYNANPTGFLQYIQKHHPDDKVTMKLIREVIRKHNKSK